MAHLYGPMKEMASRGEVHPEDVLTLRRKIFADGVVSKRQADALFALSREVRGRTCAEWTDFFLEAMTDYLVNQAVPHGYVSEENADWLIAHISHDGHVDTELELELLVTVMERAQKNPQRLIRFALDQVRLGVVHGEGPVGRRHVLSPGVIQEDEVELVRRMIYAFGGDQNIAVTRAEAEVLFDINDETSEAENHPAWSDLFVKAVANFLLSASGYSVPKRTEALRRETWLNTRDEESSFFSRMLATGLKGVVSAYRQGDQNSAWENRLHERRLGQLISERITEEEAEWLLHRIGRSGEIHENERALLRFLRDEAMEIHPRLQPLIEMAA